MREDTGMEEISDKAVYLDIRDTGIHFEHMEDFENSYYRMAYINAFQRVDDIIKHNRKAAEKYMQGIRQGRYLPDDGRLEVNYEKFSNIITFVGRRGCGKTSVMLSLMGALRSYYYNGDRHGDSLFYIFKSEPNILFTCLDCIDGSLLEHGEDIFKIVLAQMYQKFIDLERGDRLIKNESFDYRKRELLKGLEEIYKTVCDIENMDSSRVHAGESYMRGLQSLSSSQKVKKSFEELIRKFTASMKYKSNERGEIGQEHYVVITIDDIDLNIRNGFSMLEKIHRYCMVPNVIVLLSVDMEQILSIATQNFFEVLPRVDSIMKKGNKRIRKLAMDYLNKVMPVNYRVYLPEIGDLYSKPFVRIRKEKTNIKFTILGKLYRRIGICFDLAGKGRHFYEPKSMRHLTGYYLLLENMERLDLDIIYSNGQGEEFDKRKQDVVRQWEKNCQLLMSDLLYRMAYEMLYDDRDCFELFESIVKGNAYRAKWRVMDFIHKHGDGLQGDAEKRKNKGEYSYGELVEALYDIGHMEGEKYKSLFHCLLAYFSYVFTRQYIFEKFAVKNDYGEILANKWEFSSLVGKNLLDQWLADLLPKICIYRDMGTVVSESSSTSFRDTETVTYTVFEHVKVGEVFVKTLEDPEGKSKEELFQYIAGTIQDFEALTLFFRNIRENQESEKILELSCWDYDIVRDFKGKYKLSIKQGKAKILGVSYVGDFNVLNFILNSMYAVDILEKTETKLRDCFYNKYIPKKMRRGDFKARYKKALEPQSLITQYKKWEEEFGAASMPFPVYWFDFSYNIFKRARQELSKENPAVIEQDKMFRYMKKLYKYLGDQMELQKNFYKYEGKNREKEDESDDLSGSPDYLDEMFKKCPVVRYFLDDGEGSADEQRKEKFITGVLGKLRGFSESV